MPSKRCLVVSVARFSTNCLIIIRQPTNERTNERTNQPAFPIQPKSMPFCEWYFASLNSFRCPIWYYELFRVHMVWCIFSRVNTSANIAKCNIDDLFLQRLRSIASNWLQEAQQKHQLGCLANRRRVHSLFVAHMLFDINNAIIVMKPQKTWDILKMRVRVVMYCDLPGSKVYQSNLRILSSCRYVAE